MESPNSMWRTELYHAASVHFPIAVLSLAAVIALMYLACYKKKIAGNLRFTISLLLWIGFITFWVSYYTGKNAYPIVVREICNPQVLKAHLYWAYISGYIFGAAFLLDIIRYFVKVRIIDVVMNVGVILCLWAGAGILAYAGHLGASVVYEQAGGVNVPGENCEGF